MDFEEEHARWLEAHLQKRSGERRGRLERGHGHGEKLFLRNVWWPLHGNLDHLHPEFEVLDWRGRPFFVDFVWMPGHVKIALEVKGFGPHVRDIDRKWYCDELNRETFLQGLGFQVVSVPYDDVEERPELIINLLRVLFSRYLIGGSKAETLLRIEREVLMLALQMNKPIRPQDIVKKLGINHRTAVRYLQTLCEKGRMRPILGGRGTKVVRYELVRHFSDDFVW
mgnify:CR=1 FL=1